MGGEGTGTGGSLEEADRRFHGRRSGNPGRTEGDDGGQGQLASGGKGSVARNTGRRGVHQEGGASGQVQPGSVKTSRRVNRRLPSRRTLREGNFVFVRALQSQGKGDAH